MAAGSLTPKQQRFVEEYLVDLNATQAAIRAGYSARTAEPAGSRLLRNVKVAAAISEGQQARQQRTQTVADQVVRELARVAFSDMRCFAKWGPTGVTLLSSDQLSDDAAACVAEVSQTISVGGGSIRFKLHSKPQALQQLGNHLGIFKDRDPLEALLAALPSDLGRAMREALARLLSGG